jgi:cation-transporting ATPase 13A1
MTREDAERGLSFAGFLVFHCPLKEDAVASLKMLADSSHRVRECHSYLGIEHVS